MLIKQIGNGLILNPVEYFAKFPFILSFSPRGEGTPLQIAGRGLG
jgi:hypothetical protein